MKKSSWIILLAVLLLTLACGVSSTPVPSEAPAVHSISTPTTAIFSSPVPLTTQTAPPSLPSATLQGISPTLTVFTTAAATPTPALGGGLSDFPSTILYGTYGGGAGPCSSILGETSKQGISAEICEYYQPGTRGMVINIWGLPLDGLIRVALTSPDGKQSMSGEFGVGRASDGNTRVLWPDLENYDVGAFGKRMDNVPFVQLGVWWPGGLPTGTWTLKVVTGGQTLRGKFNVPEITHPWISLVYTGHELQMRNDCHYLPVGSAVKPIPVMGAGFKPGQDVPLVLYLVQTVNDHPTLVQQQLLKVTTDSHGRIATTLELGGLPGKYWLVPSIEESKPFFENNDRTSIDDVADCFVAR